MNNMKEHNKQENNNNIFIIIIIVLLVIIAILAFMIWKNSWTNNWNTIDPVNNTWANVSNDIKSDLKITVIDDKRCTNCQTEDILAQLEQIPFVSSAAIEKKDFSDESVAKYLTDNEINFLPAIIFSTNDIEDNDMKQYLTSLNSWEYSLSIIWAKYDPFAERSDKWFLLIDKEKLQEIKSESYTRWNADARITWLEYSDLECPFCAMFHKWTVDEDLTEKYWDNLNKVFNHFPLDFHKNAMPWAEVLECLWEQLWSDAFYNLIDISYASANQLPDWNIDTSASSSKDFLIEEAVKLWADKDTLESCVNDETYQEKITKLMNNWSLLFWVTWTPWSVLINNETWEYEVISWAYPTESFTQVIDKLLWE